LHLKNTTNGTVKAAVLIHFADGTYQPDGFELQPHQSIALDIQKLKDSRKPDVLGHVLPSDATRGQLLWFQTTPYTMIGRAEGTDAAAGIARSFSCGGSCCDNYWVDYFLNPYPMNGYAAGGAAFTAKEIVNFCDNSQYTYLNVQSQAYSWVSGTPSVASVNSAGNVSFLTGGTSNVVASFNGNVYTWNDTFTTCSESTGTYTGVAPVNVNPPNHLVVVDDNTGITAACPAKAIIGRQLALNTVDVNGTPVIGASVQETQPNFISVTTNTCGNGQPQPAPCADQFPTTAEFVDNIGIHSCNITPPPPVFMWI
jgi:hypothetical protein